MTEDHHHHQDYTSEGLNNIPNSSQSIFPIDKVTDNNMNLIFQNQEMLNMAQFLHPQTMDDNKEKLRISSRMQGFDPKDNDVWRHITQRFGANVKQPELLSIATVVAQNANVKLDRDAKRRKSVLIKWFQENWSTISPYLDFVVLEDSQNPN